MAARRMASHGGRRPSRISGGATPSLPLGSGSFSRSSKGTYHTSATTIATAENNIKRYEDRGDGYGPVLLMEGPATNKCVQSEIYDSWDFAGAPPTITANDATAPDGTATADKLEYALDDYGPLNQIAQVDALHCSSEWIKAAAGGDVGKGIRNRYGRKVQDAATREWIKQEYTLTADWVRDDQTSEAASTGGSEDDFLLFDHRAGLPEAGDSQLAAVDVHRWGSQWELGTFPTSYIRSGAGATSRSTEVLTLAAGQVPSWFTSGKWAGDFFPHFSSSDDHPVASGNFFYLFSFDATNYLRYNPADNRIYISIGGTSNASGVLTFSRHQKLTISLDFPGSMMTVEGATVGDGEYTATGGNWPDDVTLTVAKDQGGTANSYYGRLRPPRKA